MAENISKEELKKLEVLKFQEEIRDAVSYSRKAIATRLEKEYGVDTFNAKTDSVALYRLMEKLPKGIKEEYLSLYQEKGREQFLEPKTPVFDSMKLQVALLEEHGVKLEVIEGNDVDVSNSDELNPDEESNIFDTITVIDKNGDKLEVTTGFYNVDTLVDITQNLCKNNWLCKV